MKKCKEGKGFYKKPSISPFGELWYVTKKCIVVILKKLINIINLLIDKFYDHPQPTKPKVVMKLVYTTPQGIVIKGNDMSAVIRNDQKISFALAFEDAHGNPVTELGSMPAWELDDNELATLVVAEDGMSADVIPTGPRGSVNVSVVVDADPDEDIEELVGQAEISILSGKAKVIRLSGVISDIAEEAPAPVDPVEPEQPGEGDEGEAPVDPEQPEQPEEPQPEQPGEGEGEEEQPQQP